MTLSAILAEVSGECLSNKHDTRSVGSVSLFSSGMDEKDSFFRGRIDSSSFGPTRYLCACTNLLRQRSMGDLSAFCDSSDDIACVYTDVWIWSVEWWLTPRERRRRMTWVQQWRIIVYYLTVHLDKEPQQTLQCYCRLQAVVYLMLDRLAAHRRVLNSYWFLLPSRW